MGTNTGALTVCAGNAGVGTGDSGGLFGISIDQLRGAASSTYTGEGSSRCVEFAINTCRVRELARCTYRWVIEVTAFILEFTRTVVM